MKFETQYRERKRVLSNVGSPVKITFGGSYDADGRIVLQEKGRVNIYDEIQSHRDSCDINVIMRRVANGEPDLLSKVQGSYGDFTEFPSSYADMLNRVRDAEEIFERLPLAVRAEYDHSVARWLADFGSDRFYESIGMKKAEAAEQPESGAGSPPSDQKEV